MFFKKILSLALVLCTLLSVLAMPSIFSAKTDTANLSAAVDTAETSADYGHAKNIQDGNILHCFNWKYSDIKAELKNIAAAGFTSVQTSPAQPAAGGEWYWLYQPYSFNVGNGPLGSKSDLQALCQEAEKYGIKVIVDVVANHLNGETHRVQSDLQDGQYWHNHGGVGNWSDRYQVTHGEIGMRDLNSEHSYVQQVVANYIKELESIGVDGIRWDAAKHISLPSEGCNFWPAVTNNSMWHYGEILVGPDDRGSGNEGLMVEYTKYMSVTDSSFGMTLRESFGSGNVPQSIGNWSQRGVANNKLVYWGESHDTYSNGYDWGYSHGMSQNTIDRAYAVAASRNGNNALYFSRPGSTDKSNIRSGQKGSTAFKNTEIAAVNQLKNACVGEKDYYIAENNNAAVCRESGAVIVAGRGGDFNVSISNGGGTTKPGTYKDLVSGSTWTVTSSTISGKIGSSGIAVLLNYNPKPAGPSVSVTPSSQAFKTDSITLTLNVSNATSGQYSIDGGAYQNFTNGQKITVGAGKACGTKTTVTVKVQNGNSETYTYTKADPSATGIYFNNSSTNWSQVYCYIYNDQKAYAEWPGKKMTNEGSNVWFMDVPKGFENCKVLFTDAGGQQIPGASESGLDYADSPMIYKNNSWSEYMVVKPTAPRPTTPKPTQTKPTQPLPTNPVGGDTYLYGDADQSGAVTVKDATLVQKHCSDLEALSVLAQQIAKVTGNANLTVRDATEIQKKVAGVISEFTVGKWYGGNAVSPAPTVKPTTAPTQPKPIPPAPTQSKPTNPPVTTDNTIYFKNTSGWGSVSAYVWNSSTGEEAFGSWPGGKMTYVSGDVYKLTLDTKYNMIIFSDNGSAQSADLSIPGSGQIFNYAQNSWSIYSGSGNNNGSNNNNNNQGSVKIYFVDTNGWGSAKAICWSNSNSNQRDEITMQSCGENRYMVNIDKKYDKLYFTNGNQKSQDFDVPQNGGTYTYNQGWS